MSVLWDEVKVALAPSLGAQVALAPYVLLSLDDKGFVLQRPATGSTVRVTRSKVEKTLARLEAGEAIPFRKIDYTVAVETGVLLALGERVSMDEDARVYRLSVRS